ncbi:hypothetical protein OE09_1473 [Flavobacteriaceae bacterium MAR_2010_72]|nr:hypothetical protein OE09_1473 [Flavobacteriaceae bacterium MAR_2010_72]TVZ59800.1 hypothetical protein NA63_2340 [Flavobacteriaceae bacterium MAR_2010_105]
MKYKVFVRIVRINFILFVIDLELIKDLKKHAKINELFINY